MKLQQTLDEEKASNKLLGQIICVSRRSMKDLLALLDVPGDAAMSRETSLDHLDKKSKRQMQGQEKFILIQNTKVFEDITVLEIGKKRWPG